MLIKLSEIDAAVYENSRKVHNAEKFAALKRAMAADEERAKAGQTRVIPPVHVCPHPMGEKSRAKWALVFGYTRLNAARDLGLSAIFAEAATKALSMREARVLNLNENIHRADLSPCEIAESCLFLIAQKATRKEIAQELHLSETNLSNYLRVAGLAVFDDWKALNYARKPAPTFREMLEVAKEKNADKARVVFDRFTGARGKVRDVDAIGAPNGGKGKNGKGCGPRTSVRVGFEIGDLMRAARKAMRLDMADGISADYLQGIVDACEFALKEREAPITILDEQGEALPLATKDTGKRSKRNRTVEA